MPASEAALTGIRVVDLGGTISTGYCGKLFAGYGAEVINVEPADGCETRHIKPFVASEGGGSALHAWLSTGKKSVVCSDHNREAVASLVASAQLVIDSGEHEFAANCQGVRTSIDWYGEGPCESFVGSDAQMFAFNGMLRNIGTEDGPPLIPAGYQAQIVGGITAYIPSLAEVLGRELGNASGVSHIETSIYEAMLCFTEVGVVGAYNTGIEGTRMGINRFPPTYPLGVFPCKDGWLGVTVLTPSQWRAFCELLDMAELADVEMFQSAVGRLQALDIIEPIFSEKLLKQSAEDLFYRGQQMAIPLARVPTMEELFGVDQFVSRQAFVSAVLPNRDSISVPGIPFRLHATPPGLGGKVAAVGEHTGDY